MADLLRLGPSAGRGPGAARSIRQEHDAETGLRGRHPALSDPMVRQRPPAAARGAGAGTPAAPEPQRRSGRDAIYLISTVAPAPSSCALSFAASSLDTASLTGLRRRLDEILGLLQAEAGDRAHFLDHVDLLRARGRQDHVELGLLLAPGRRRRGAAAAAAPRRGPPPNALYVVGVSAAAPVAAAAAGGRRRGGAGRVEEQTEFDVILTASAPRRSTSSRRSARYRPGPEGGQGSRRGRAEGRQGGRLQGRGRQDQGPARGRRRHRGDQVDRSSDHSHRCGRGAPAPVPAVRGGRQLRCSIVLDPIRPGAHRAVRPFRRRRDVDRLLRARAASG